MNFTLILSGDKTIIKLGKYESISLSLLDFKIENSPLVNFYHQFPKT
jgi:hypothetical protein